MKSNSNLRVGDDITWTYIPERTTENLEDEPEFVRLYNIENHGNGPFKILNIYPHPIHRDRIILVEISDKNGNKIAINKLAFTKIK